MRLLITTQAVDVNDPILGFFHRWLIEFSKHFEHIDVICLREGEHNLPKNVTIHSLGKEHGENRLKYLVRFYRYFFLVFFRKRVDVVLFHMGAIYNVLAFPFFLMRGRYRTKFMWWKTHGLLNLTGKLALACVDEVVTAGGKSFNANSKKVRVVGHAIDTDVFTLPTPGSPSKNLRVLAVGRVTPIKKLEVAIAAVAKLSDTTLLIVGPTTDGRYKEELESLIRTHGLATVVTFEGSRPPHELPSVYHRHDVLIHPAYDAGFDKVVLEAMASGVIPLTSIRSFEAILAPHGLYVGPRDSGGYREHLARIRDMTPATRYSLGTELRDIVVRDHSIGTLSARVFGVL